MTVNIFFKGDNYSLDSNKSFEYLLKEKIKLDMNNIVGVRFNNTLKELTQSPSSNGTIELVKLDTFDGEKIYQRTLTLIFIKAAKEVIEGCKVEVEHSLSKGLYCKFLNNTISDDIINEIEKRMQAIVKRNEPIIKTKKTSVQAKQIFEKFNLQSKIDILDYREEEFINMYTLGWYSDYFYGYMAPSTGYINLFKLQKHKNGVIITHPTKFSNFEMPEFRLQKKLSDIYSEAEQWGEILGVEYISSLNKSIEQGEIGHLIRVAEALHEKKISQIADQITESEKRIILIAGPSSSGKTTFSDRLLVQLQVNGLKPIRISVDDFFVEREETPLDQEGKPDYESIYAIDLELFNEKLKDVLEGKEVDMPTFNFKSGKKEYLGNTLKVEEDQLIIIEGIHGLNDLLTQSIPSDEKFKIYICPLTQLSIDEHNRIHTSDLRLLRRLVRDYIHRGYSALNTLNMWGSVRRGEEKNIYPHQETADAIFNSSLIYELSLLKKYAEPLLEEIDKDERAYVRANRMLKFLQYIRVFDDEQLIPCTSILKEFIGGSCFRKDH